MAVFELVDDYQDLEHDTGVLLKEKTLNKDRREPQSFVNMDKPYFITTKIAGSHREAAEKDLTAGPLHAFMLNGRKPDDLLSYFKKNADTRLQFSVVTKAAFCDKMLNLFHNLFCMWSQHIYNITGNSSQYPKNGVVFLTDKKNPDKVYLPCCNDVKRIKKEQLLHHYSSCMSDRVGKTKCGFCSSTNVETGVSLDTDFSAVHVSSNNHLNSIYQVLILDENKGLMMADSRITYDYLCARPMGNLFLTLYAHPHSEESYVDFLSTHVANALRENTPFFGMLTKLIRMASNYGRDYIDFQCERCDCSGTTFSRFYIAQIFGREAGQCECGGVRYRIGIADFKSKVEEIKNILEKRKNSTMTVKDIQSRLTAAFKPGQESTADAISKSDIDKLFRVCSGNPLVMVDGSGSSMVHVTTAAHTNFQPLNVGLFQHANQGDHRVKVAQLRANFKQQAAGWQNVNREGLLKEAASQIKKMRKDNNPVAHDLFKEAFKDFVKDYDMEVDDAFEAEINEAYASTME